MQLQLEELQQDLLQDARTKDEQVCVTHHSIYSLYWYKSTSSDTLGAERSLRLSNLSCC